jgi:hypothetical protein
MFIIGGQEIIRFYNAAHRRRKTHRRRLAPRNPPPDRWGVNVRIGFSRTESAINLLTSREQGRFITTDNRRIDEYC